jgi:hypothetical protein
MKIIVILMRYGWNVIEKKNLFPEYTVNRGGFAQGGVKLPRA